MKSFWSLSTLDKCAALAALVQTLSKAGLTSLPMLAEARGETIEQIWQRCCREAGIVPCTMPQSLFSRPQEEESVPMRDEDELTTTGFAARARLLAELGRDRPLQLRHLHAHTERS